MGPVWASYWASTGPRPGLEWAMLNLSTLIYIYIVDTTHDCPQYKHSPHGTHQTLHNTHCTIYIYIAHYTLQAHYTPHATQYALPIHLAHHKFDATRITHTTHQTLHIIPTPHVTHCISHALHYLTYDTLFTTPYTTHATHSTLHATCCTVCATQCFQVCEWSYCVWKLSRLLRDCSLAGVP